MNKYNSDDAIYQVTVEDVLEVADSLGIPREEVTDAVVDLVQSRLDTAFEKWSEVIEDALAESLAKFSLN